MIIIGQIARSFGKSGEVMVLAMTDSPQRLCDLETVSVGHDEAMVTRWDVESARLARDGVILKLKGVDTIAAAQPLRGQYLYVTPEEVPPLPPDSHYIFRIIGMTVIREDGSPVGRVVDVLTFPANDVYVVDDGTGEVLIPATKEVVRAIDTDTGLMVIRPLPGLLEI